MKDTLVAKLVDINREFYGEFARSFSASRANTEPGLDRILKSVQSGERILDLGCGQGRIAQLLPTACVYVGLDFSREMLLIAEEATHNIDLAAIRYILVDLSSSDWAKQLVGCFDWIIIRAVLHHIPAYDNRCKILKQAGSVLAPNGKIIVANWQFLDIPRLARRRLPWSVVGIDDNDLEAGDYLLDWQRDGHGVRYLHLVDENETRALASDAGLRVQTMYRADGHQNRLTLYAVLENDR